MTDLIRNVSINIRCKDPPELMGHAPNWNLINYS